jgi:hypothetical protein
MWRGSGRGRRRRGIELRDVAWLEFVLITLPPSILKCHWHSFTLTTILYVLGASMHRIRLFGGNT